MDWKISLMKSSGFNRRFSRVFYQVFEVVGSCDTVLFKGVFIAYTKSKHWFFWETLKKQGILAAFVYF